MIQASRGDVRRQYEELEVETLIRYPRRTWWRIRHGVEHGEDVTPTTPVEADLDLGRFRKVIGHTRPRQRCRRFDIGRLARKLSESRKQAEGSSGKVGAQLALQVALERHYGVTASQHQITKQHVVCANVITATARAIALAGRWL